MDSLRWEARSRMVDEMHTTSETDRLPGWQRLAWIAAIWFASVALLGLAILAVSVWVRS